MSTIAPIEQKTRRPVLRRFDDIWTACLSFRAGTTGGLIALLSGAGAAQIIALIASPILTRLYSPADFGLFATFSGILSIACIVATLRYEDAIPLPDDDLQAVGLLWVSLLVALLLGGVVCLAVVLGNDLIESLIGHPGINQYLWLLPIAVTAAGAQAAGNYWSIRKQRFPLVAKTAVTRGVAQTLVQVFGGFLMTGPIGLIAGRVADTATGILPLYRAMWSKDRPLIKRRVPLSRLVELALRYSMFPRTIAPAALLSTAGTHIVPVILTATYGIQVAGWYALSNRVVLMPLNMVGGAVASYYYGVAPALFRSEPREVYRLYVGTARKLLGLGLAIVGLSAILAPSLFSLIFGEAWESAGTYLLCISGMVVAHVAVYPLKKTLIILEQHGLQLGWEFLTCVLPVAVIGGGVVLGLTDVEVIAVFGSSMMLAYLGLYEQIRRILQRKTSDYSHNDGQETEVEGMAV